LINLSNQDEDALVRYSLYDLKYAINNNITWAQKIITNFLSSDKLDPKVLEKIMIENLDLFKSAPELKASFWENWEIMNKVIWTDKIDEYFDNAVQTFDDLKSSAEENIKNMAEETGKIIEKWWELVNEAGEALNNAKDEVVEWATDLKNQAEDAIKSGLNNLINPNK
jgi:hypothetical protein